MLALLLAAVLYQEPEKIVVKGGGWLGLGVTAAASVDVIVEQERPERPTLEERIEAARQEKIADGKREVALQQAHLKLLRTELVRAKRGKPPLTNFALDVPAQLRRIASAKKDLQSLEQNKPPFRLVLPPRPAVGDVGMYPGDHRVVQVIDDDEMLVEFTVGMKMIVVSPTKSLLGPFTRTMWLRGLPTENLTDRDKIPYDGYFEVTGSRQYTTVLGATKTVHVLEPIE